MNDKLTLPQRALLKIWPDYAIEIGVYGFWGFLKKRFIDLFPYRWQRWWDCHIRTVYNPQHSELRAAIPKTWQDLPEIIPSFLYAAVISYVEKEDGLTRWEYQDDEHCAKKNAAMLREVYEWAKTGRAFEEERILALHPPFTKGTDVIEWLNEENPQRDECYKRVWEAEAARDAKDERYLQWIVSNNVRQSLWT